MVSELRKGTRCQSSVSDWFSSVAGSEKFLSLLTVGEIRKGIENIRRRDAASAKSLDAWVASLFAEYSERVLPITGAIAQTWGRLNVPHPLPVVDGLLAATALEHGLTLVTRNVGDVTRARLSVINPFAPG